MAGSLSGQQTSIAALGKRVADADQATDARAEIIGSSAPIAVDRRLTPERSGDFAMTGAGAGTVESTERRRPMLRATIGRIERPWKAPEPLQSEEPLKDDEFRFDARGASEIVAEPSRSLEQAAVPHLDLDTVASIAKQDMFDAVASL